ncbi:MAG: helix-turn-helix transcriptional regulator [Planctomycetota bacterium]|nr:helix-turn-helix transcriptional regulator [Planctomycetota bacterium]
MPSDPNTADLIKKRISAFGSQRFGFSRTEIRILTLMCFGNSTVQIAEQLRVAPATVSAHIRSMFKKSRVRTRVELISRTFLELLSEDMS